MANSETHFFKCPECGLLDKRRVRCECGYVVESQMVPSAVSEAADETVADAPRRSRLQLSLSYVLLAMAVIAVHLAIARWDYGFAILIGIVTLSVVTIVTARNLLQRTVLGAVGLAVLVAVVLSMIIWSGLLGFLALPTVVAGMHIGAVLGALAGLLCGLVGAVVYGLGRLGFHLFKS